MAVRADNGRHRQVRRGRARRVGRTTGRAVTAGVSAALLVATAWGSFNLAALDDNAHTVHVQGLDPVAGPTQAAPSGSGSAIPVHVDGPAQNILIVGNDSRAGLTEHQKAALKVGDGDGSMSTDTIMLVHVPADGSKATLVSIPRDSWVSIPGYKDAKINAAYADGYNYGGATTPKGREEAGEDLLLNVVKQLTGVPINHYVTVGFEGFEKIVEAIGTIPVDLCHSVDDTHAYNVAHHGDGGSGFHMTAGPHDLTPEQALEFVRQRHNIPGKITDDFGRELRQRYFLHAAFDRVLSAGVLLNPFRLRKLVNAIDESFTFDDNGMNVTSFIEQMSNLTAGNIVGRSIPTDGNITVGSPPTDAIAVDPAKVRAAVHDAFYGAPASSSHSAGHKKHRNTGVTGFAHNTCIN